MRDLSALAEYRKDTVAKAIAVIREEDQKEYSEYHERERRAILRYKFRRAARRYRRLWWVPWLYVERPTKELARANWETTCLPRELEPYGKPDRDWRKIALFDDLESLVKTADGDCLLLPPETTRALHLHW